MTARRRFFPVKPVQQVPGQRVEVEVSLAKQGAAPQSCPCAPTGFFWAAQLALKRYEEGDPPYYWFETWFPEMEIGDSGLGDQFKTPNLNESVIWPELDSYYENDGVVIKKAAVLAIPLGPAAGIEWSLSWENGYQPNRRIEFEQLGAVASVFISKVEGQDEFIQAVAILTATCGGRVVGTMRLVVMPDLPS